jgi:hypothetical protein
MPTEIDELLESLNIAFKASETTAANSHHGVNI